MAARSGKNPHRAGIGRDHLRRLAGRSDEHRAWVLWGWQLTLCSHDGILRSRHSSGTPPKVHIPVVEEFADRLTKKMGSREGALVTEVFNRTATAHFTGGIPIGDSSKSGAVDPYQRVFGQPGLHVMDGSVMPANPGVNPSLTITALAERAMSLWPNKGDADTRPPLGSGYERIGPIMPHRTVVPAGALGELRLGAGESRTIPAR